MICKVFSTSPTFGHYIDEPVEYLKKHGCEVDIVSKGQVLPAEELKRIISTYDAVIVGVEKINEQLIQKAEKLRVIAKHGAGVDNIDVATATKKGIAVINAPGANSDAVADLTFGLFLSLARNIPYADSAVKHDKWPRIIGTQLNGKVVGIVGLGQIGKKVAKRALGFDMKVVAYDVKRDDSFTQRWGITYLPLEKIMSEADFISIHIPLLPETRGLINGELLRSMKKSSFIVNISRGDIIDEESLYQTLKEGGIRGAGLDVFTREPPQGSPLMKLANVVCTPHMGGYTFDALRKTGMICAQGIIDVWEGRHPQFIANPEVIKK
jgi:D-3-phosphoglycerate dehydrogenase